MTTIVRIARAELASLFYSPVAWLVLVVFCFQSALQFTGTLNTFLTAQLIGAELNNLTQRIFVNPAAGGLLADVQSKLMLYIPLLTMGVFSREISSGSIKLLLSSPVKISWIVLGKFLAVVAYGVLLISMLGLFVVAGYFTIASFDVWYIISGLIGLFLLICAYAAIGLFMSCLTSYQIVAAISTLVVLAGLNYVGTLWQDVDLVRDLTYFLSLAGRTNDMIDGLISSKDVGYFVLVTLLFLGFSILKLRADRTMQPWPVRLGGYVALVCVAMGVGYLSTRPVFVGYLDMTHTGHRTLTPQSTDLLKQIEEDVSLTTYVNLLDENFYVGSPQQRNADLDRFEAYTRFLPNMKMHYVYYYDTVDNKYLYQSNPGLSSDEIARKAANAHQIAIDLFMPPGEARQQFGLLAEENRLVRKLTIGEHSTYLRMYKDMLRHPSEAEITTAFKRIIAGRVKVAFVTGNRERTIHQLGDRSYQRVAREKTFRYALPNQGFDADTIMLEVPIPADVELLVLADPQQSLSDAAIQHIYQYIDAGGNLLVAGDPGPGAVNLQPLLTYLGAHWSAQPLQQAASEYPADYVFSSLTPFAIEASEQLGFQAKMGNRVLLPGAMGIRCDPSGAFVAQPLLTAQPVAEVTALLLSRAVANREQRIVIMGDADFMTNAEMERNTPATANFAFTMQVFNWLSNDRYPLAMNRPQTNDTVLNITPAGLTYLKFGYLGGVPALLVLAGALLLAKRRRK